MPKIAYQEFNFRNSTISLIKHCNAIIEDYTRQGLRLTLRQLYYLLVTLNIIPNTIKEYNRLGNTVSDARLGGLIDWNAIEDRTRALESIGHFETPANVIAAAHNSYRVDRWSTQEVRPEVWIEKEALAGVFEQICTPLDVPYLSCRGYTSQSEMWSAAMRFVGYLNQGKDVMVFHFGDHDPSGIDMSRDIEDRLRMFISHHTLDVRFSIKRIALNMNQVEQYNPPENPAKSTDTRFADYQAKFGDSSWELDALNPTILRGLITDEILAIRDEEAWDERKEYECKGRALLSVASQSWPAISNVIEKRYSASIDRCYASELQNAK